MANSQSITTLGVLAVARADQTNSPAFDFTNEIKPWVRQSCAQLYEVMVSRWVDYYVVARPLSLLAGQQSYSLPVDFRAMQEVYALQNLGKIRVPLRVMDSAQSMGRGGMTYKIYRGQIYFGMSIEADYPNAIEFYYTPQWQGPLTDYSTIDSVLPNGWEEWVVLDVMQKMHTKMRLPIDAIEMAKQEQAHRLEVASSVRDGEAPMMQDTYFNADNRPYYDTFDYGFSFSGPVVWTVP
jgi:hypothetical protein